MAKDPAFLFYPGDYLRDTQCLSEKSQVAYDRIMCEHMRNICIRQEQLNFFIKRLNEDEKNEICSLLTKIKGGYQIEWVAESICKRKDYSESRRKNREGKPKNISTSYDSHMENAIESEDVNRIKNSDNSKIEDSTVLSVFVLEAAEMNQFTHTGDRNTEFIKNQWEIFVLERNNDPPYKKAQNNGRLGEYFLNWIRTKFPKELNGKKQDPSKLAKAKKILEEKGDEKI